MRRQFLVLSIVLLAAIGGLSTVWKPILWSLILVGPIILWGLTDMYFTKTTILRNFPIVGRGRYIMEALRPKIYQYFIESDIDGTPINRVFRSLVYQRAKKELDTVPFGTEFDVYRVGYEYIHHSLGALDAREVDHDLRVSVGGKGCSQPYDASILNISAMSYGALSKNAILALNGGAKKGNFAHNTGEGGMSPFHLEHGGDLADRHGLFRDPHEGWCVLPRYIRGKVSGAGRQDDRNQVVPRCQARTRRNPAWFQEHARNCGHPWCRTLYGYHLSPRARHFHHANRARGIHRAPSGKVERQTRRVQALRRTTE